MKLWNSRRNYQYGFDRTAVLQLWSKHALAERLFLEHFSMVAS